MHPKIYDKSLLNYIESQVMPIPESGCWLWDNDFRLPVGFDNLPAKIDKFIYQAYQGSVLDNIEIIHVCNVDCCIRPDHMTLANG